MPNDFDTSQYPLGSMHPYVLYNNAGNEDLFVNDVENETWVDRPPFNRVRKTIYGMEQDFSRLLAASGFELPAIPYAAGVVIARPSQLISYLGNVYSVKANATFPYTLDGTFATDEPNLVLRSDQSLRTELAGGITRIPDVATLRATPGRYDGDRAELTGWYASRPGVGDGPVYWIAGSSEVDDGGITFAAPGGVWKRPSNRGVWVEDFGAQNDGTDTLGTTTAAVWSAIRAVRSNPTSMLQYIGGPTITGYTSGKVNFGRGVFALAADTFDITQDEGLTLVGQGGRGMNQALPAATTLLQKGTSSGFFWRHYGNAARALAFIDLDVCYEGSSFTGDVIDTYASPDLFVGRGVRVGCYGGFAGTRVQTARSCIRATYPERATLDHCVIDGAIDGVWHDYTRTLGGSNFGGWGMNMHGVTFYDFTGNHVRCADTRAQFTLSMTECNFNPINASPVRIFDLANIEGFRAVGCIFTPSTTAQPTAEYFKVLGCTGSLTDNVFLGATSKVGTIGGPNPSSVKWEQNTVSCGFGLTITGGIVRGGGNEYSNADNGVTIAPVAGTTVDIGPDIFKAGVTGNSYLIAADSVLLGGRINYDAERDASNSRFSNASSRITIRNLDERIVTQAALPATASPFFSGRTYNVTVAGTFTLPTPQPGIRLRILKGTAAALTVAAGAGTNFTIGATAARTNAVATAAEIGSQIEFVGLNATTWIAETKAGTWTFS